MTPAIITLLGEVVELAAPLVLRGLRSLLAGKGDTLLRHTLAAAIYVVACGTTECVPNAEKCIEYSYKMSDAFVANLSEKQT